MEGSEPEPPKIGRLRNSSGWIIKSDWINKSGWIRKPGEPVEPAESDREVEDRRPGDQAEAGGRRPELEDLVEIDNEDIPVINL